MAYEHTRRGAGEVILSDEWNRMGLELQRVGGVLEQDDGRQTVKLPIPLAIAGKGAPKSPLSVSGGASVGAEYAESAAPENGLVVQGKAGVGTADPQARLHVVHSPQDANGGALVLGPTSASNLRMGYHADYSWVQSHGGKPLRVNPLGNNLTLCEAAGSVGIGVADPKAQLHISSEISVGPVPLGGAQGRISTSGDKAEFSFVKRTLGAWPARAQAGDRFVWYNPDGTARLWTEAVGDLVTVQSDGDTTFRGKVKSGNAREIRSANNKVDLAAGRWVQLEGMELKITVGASPVLVLFKAGGLQVTGSANARVRFQLVIDGGQQAFTLHEFHNQGWDLRDVTLHWLGTLTAGTHVIGVNWHNEAGTAGICWYNDTRSLIAVEL